MVVELVARNGAISGEASRLSWLRAQQRERERIIMAKKIRKKAGFSPTFAFDFLILNVWNPPLFIGG
jgi:hypothetical protein